MFHFLPPQHNNENDTAQNTQEDESTNDAKNYYILKGKRSVAWRIRSASFAFIERVATGLGIPARPLAIARLTLNRAQVERLSGKEA